MALSKELLDETFAVLVACAVAKERCPITNRHCDGVMNGLPNGHTAALAKAGKIKIEVFSRNFRRVTILVGPHRGKTTADPPDGPDAKPYRVVTTETYEFRHKARSQPYNPAAGKVAP